MTRRRLPESVTDALALSAGVAANFASSANWRGESVRLDILPSVLPLVAAGQEQPSYEGCRAGRALLLRFIYWFLATFLPALPRKPYKNNSLIVSTIPLLINWS